MQIKENESQIINRKREYLIEKIEENFKVVLDQLRNGVFGNGENLRIQPSICSFLDSIKEVAKFNVYSKHFFK